MIRKFFPRIRHPFMANSFYLYLSHFADYFLALFILPFVVRNIGVEEFGKIGLSQTFGIFIILFMEFGFSLMATRNVAIEKQNMEKIKLFIGQITTFKILLIPITILITIVIILFVPTFYQNPHYLIIVSLGAIFQGLAPTWYFQGVERMKQIALSKTVFRIIGFIIILLFVGSPGDAWIVLASYSVSSVFICMYLFIAMNNIIGKFDLVSISQVKQVFSKSKYSFIITILPTVYQNVSMIGLSFWVNPVQLGFYYGMSRIYRAFNTLYGPLGQAFFPRLSAINSQNKLQAKSLIIKFFFGMISLGLIFLSIIFIYNKQIITVLFGEEFLAASNTLKLFGLVLPLTAISHVFGRQWLMSRSKDSFYTLTQFISSIIGLIVFVNIVKKVGINAMPISLITFELITIFMIAIFLFRKND